ncbi:MAG: tetratricopeptide repeat protein [Gallionella sp.]|jgi:tetratricopeptide (TPR) repeat protein
MSKLSSLLNTGCSNALKRTLIASIVFSCVAGCNLDFMKSAESIKADTRQSIDAKNYSEAAAIAQRLTEKSPADYEGYFMLAQATAQIGDKNEAIAALEKAIKNGLKDDEQIYKNTNLDPIKSMTAYTNLININFPSKAAAPKNNVSTPDMNSSEVSGSVSIQEINGKQVVRAGDVVIEMPNTK